MLESKSGMAKPLPEAIFPVSEPGPGSAPRTKVGFVSLGCPKNLVDSEVMMGLLAQAGAEITPRAEDADVIVVNTCSFIEPAQQESVNAILEMAQLKSQGRAGFFVPPFVILAGQAV